MHLKRFRISHLISILYDFYLRYIPISAAFCYCRMGEVCIFSLKPNQKRTLTYGDKYYLLKVTKQINHIYHTELWACGLAVMTSLSHSEGRRFKSGQAHLKY